jgi:hypothetical protein
LALLLAWLGAGCATPDPRELLELEGLETYWAIDASAGNTQYLAPVARFHLKNRGPEPLKHVQATATFKRRGDEGKAWGSDFLQVTAAGKQLAPGQRVLVVLKSDARYASAGSPESMFSHQLFKDARVEVFLRVGASSWAKLAEAEVERRIGTRSLAP